MSGAVRLDKLLALIRIRLSPSLRREVESGDILQQTLLKAFQRIEQFEGADRDTLMGWLATIAWNEIRDQADYYKRLRRDARLRATWASSSARTSALWSTRAGVLLAATSPGAGTA